MFFWFRVAQGAGRGLAGKRIRTGYPIVLLAAVVAAIWVGTGHVLPHAGPSDEVGKPPVTCRYDGPAMNAQDQLVQSTVTATFYGSCDAGWSLVKP